MNELPPTIEELSAPSEYMQEVLATPPRWIIRWGEVLVSLLILMLLLLGWFIRYPDRIPAAVVITTPQPPAPVVARADGALAQLLVHDHDTVKRGELLAIIQNPARYSHVTRLKKQLSQFTTSDLLGMAGNSLFSDTYQLGTLQESYALLQQAAEDYHLYQRLTPHYQQQQAVRHQLQQYQALLAQKQNHEQLLERKLQLAEKDYRRNEQLHASQTIADKALEVSEGEWLTVRESYEALRSELSQIRVEIANLEREWQQLDTQRTQEGEQLRTALLTALDNVRSALARWEERYLLTAPQSGYVSFSDFWSEQQVVQTGQTVMSIVPNHEQAALGRLRVPVQNFGKVALGQLVRVYLENYPYQEYGTLQGKVRTISSLPKQGHYHVTINFPEGLTTQYGKEIPFAQQLQGQAEIITEDQRLLERFFYRLRASLSTNPG